MFQGVCYVGIIQYHVYNNRFAMCQPHPGHYSSVAVVCGSLLRTPSHQGLEKNQHESGSLNFAERPNVKIREVKVQSLELSLELLLRVLF